MMTEDELDKLLAINLEVAFKNFDKVTEKNCVKTDEDSVRIQELIKAMKNRPVDVEAFVERCRKREKEFKRMEERQRPDKAFYDFQYGVKND